MIKRSLVGVSLAVASVGAAVALAAGGRAVFYHGRVLTNDARQFEGRTYVPLASVAHMLGGRVVSRGADLEIVTGAARVAGGANQVEGARGGVGSWFFNGYWNFRVNSIKHANDYRNHYYEAGGSTPSGSDELVILDCTIKNGHNESEQPVLSASGLAIQNTALTDYQGQSYAPLDFDARNGALLPGASKNFSIIFSVPKNTKLKDLVFTLYGFGASKPSNVRVHLGNP